MTSEEAPRKHVDDVLEFFDGLSEGERARLRESLVDRLASERWLTKTQAASHYGISLRTLERRIREGSLRAYRFGGIVRIRERDLDQVWLEERK